MSDGQSELTAEALASLQARIPAWGGADLQVSALTGGITNRNYRVVAGDRAYVLRVGGNDTHLLGIDRDVEYAANALAARLSIGPEVVAYLQPEGYLVTRFIPGDPLPPETLRQPAGLRRVAATLRRFHDGPPIPGAFSPFRVVEQYGATAARLGVSLPEALEPALAQARRIECALYPQLHGSPVEWPGRCPCHNDLLNANFLDEHGEVRILDWEYAGMGDRYFDLGNLSANHAFEEHEDRALLAAYFAVPDAGQGRYARLQLMRIMSLFREAMWGVVQQGVSQIDFDFAGYAGQHFALLAQSFADPRYEGWLHEAAAPE